jgi:hypothetical protein
MNPGGVLSIFFVLSFVFLTGRLAVFLTAPKAGPVSDKRQNKKSAVTKQTNDFMGYSVALYVAANKRVRAARSRVRELSTKSGEAPLPGAIGMVNLTFVK